MKKLMLTMGSVLSVLAGSAEVEVKWDAANPSFAYGEMTLEGGNVKTLTPAFCGEDIVFTGDKITFAADATMTVFGRDIRFENEVETLGALSLDSGCSATYVTNCVDQGLPVHSRVVLFANAPGSLEDYDIVGATFCASADGTMATPYHPKADGDGIVVQLQGVNGPTNVKFIWVRLSKDGDNIMIELQKAGYAAKALVGSDFDVTPYTEYGLGTDIDGQGYYGIKYFSMKRKGIDVVTSQGGFTQGGAVSVAKTLDFRIVKDGTTTFAQPFGGAGDFGFSGVLNDAKTTFSMDTEELPYASWTSWFVIAENASLADVTAEDIEAKITGSQYDTPGVKYTASIVRFVNNGTNATFQAQGKPYSLKGVLMSLRQNNNNIEMRVDEARYILSSYGPKIGDDLSSANPNSAAYDYSKGHVYIDSISLKAKSIATFKMTTGVANTWAGGTLTIGSSEGAGTYYFAHSRKAWPNGGTVDVMPGATLSISNKGGGGTSTYVGGDLGTLRLHPGAQLIQEGYIEFDFTLSPYQKIVSDNALIWFGYGCTVASAYTDMGAKTAGSTYVNHLVLSNGARCVGSAIRIGSGPTSSLLSAGGTGISYFDAGISIVGTDSGDPQILEFHADEGAELDVGGVVTLYFNAKPSGSSPNGRKAQVRKTGAGLVRFNNTVNFGNVTCNSQPATQLEEGGLVLGITGCTSENLAFDFVGGGLVAATGTVNTVGTVGLKTTGTITLEDGASLAIASAPELDWADGTCLTVTGDLTRASLRFGTSSAALTDAQLKKICINNGLSARLDEDGYLHGYKNGLMLYLR